MLLKVWLLKVVPTEETTSRPTSQLKTLLSGTGIGRKFSPTPCVSWSCTRSLPIDYLLPALSSAARSSIHPNTSLVPQSCRCIIQSSPPLEFFLEFLLVLGFEARHPSEELPRFLLLGLEVLLLLHACFPEFSTSQQLRWPLIHELLSH